MNVCREENNWLDVHFVELRGVCAMVVSYSITKQKMARGVTRPLALWRYFLCVLYNRQIDR